MTVFEAMLLGLAQGLTEFIPISSSGHLVLMQTMMSGASNHLFLEWINLGTVLALIIFFRKRIFSIIHSVFVEKNYHLAGIILLAALPAGAAGFFLASIIEQTAFFSSVWTVVATLIVVGVLLVVLEKLPKLSAVSALEKFPMSRALGVGLIQVAALVPGTSRSGSTIIAGRVLGLSREHAAEFSFLVSIPIMCGVILKLLLKESDRLYFIDNFLPLLAGNIVAFLAGLLAVGFLMRWLAHKSLAVFGWYRIALALVVIGVLLVQ